MIHPKTTTRERSKAFSEDLFRLFFVGFGTIVLWWLFASYNLVDFLPEDKHVPPDPHELIVDPYSTECSPCSDPNNPFAISFSITGRFNLPQDSPPDATHIALFASRNSETWWYASDAPDFVLRNPDDKFQFPSKYCFGDPGPLYVVVCLVRDDRWDEFKKVRVTSLYDVPPFDDLCDVIGSRCDVNCGIYHSQPRQNCDVLTHSIPFDYLVASGLSYHPTEMKKKVDSPDFEFSRASLLTSVFIAFEFIATTMKCFEYSFGMCRKMRSDGKSADRRAEAKVIIYSPFAKENLTIVSRTILSSINSIYRLIEGNFDWGPHQPGRIVLVINEDSQEPDRIPLLFQPVLELIQDLDQQLDQLSDVVYQMRNMDINARWDQIVGRTKFQKFSGTDNGFSNFVCASKDEARRESFDRIMSDDRDRIPTNSRVTVHVRREQQYVQIEHPMFDVIFAWNDATTSGKGPGLNRALDRFSECGDTGRENSYFAIVDARHAISTEFLKHGLPEFFVPDPPRFVQFPQYFPAVTDLCDWTDRGGSYFFYFTCFLRNRANVVTSCGTNAIWSLRDWKSGGKFKFEVSTLVEDTESSVKVLLMGEYSVYVNERVVYGVAKDFTDYTAAVTRWSTGAVELFWKHFFDWRLMLISISFWTAVFGGTCLLSSSDLEYNRLGFTILLTVFYIFCASCTWGHSIHRYLAVWLSCWYWFFGMISSLFWAGLLPLFFCLFKPFPINSATLMVGTLVALFIEYGLISMVKRSSSHLIEVHLLRSYQIWTLFWPIVLVALVRGTLRRWRPHSVRWDIGSSTKWFIKGLMSLHVLTLIIAVAVVGFRLTSQSTSIASSNMFGAANALILLSCMAGPFSVIVLARPRPWMISGRHISLISLISGILLLWVHNPKDFRRQLTAFYQVFEYSV